MHVNYESIKVRDSLALARLYSVVTCTGVSCMHNWLHLIRDLRDIEISCIAHVEDLRQ